MSTRQGDARARPCEPRAVKRPRVSRALTAAPLLPPSHSAGVRAIFPHRCFAMLRQRPVTGQCAQQHVEHRREEDAERGDADHA